MQTVRVTIPDDIVDPNDGEISLREAVALTATDAFPGPDFIELDGIVTLDSPITIQRGNSLFFQPSPSATGRVGVDGQESTALFIIDEQEPDQNVVFQSVFLQNAFGGALRLRAGADVLIRQGATRTQFINNRSTGSGGAIFVSNGATLTFDEAADAIFEGNQTDQLGGAIFVDQGGTVNFGGLNSASFFNNSARRGGAFFIDPNGRATQEPDTQFGNQGNTATDGDPFSNVLPTVIDPNNLSSLINIDVGSNSDLAFIDENNDGDLDLFIGADDGTIRVAHNQGTPTNPDFATPIIIRDIGTRSTPTFVDIDGDGDQDLFAGDTFGRIHFFRNRGSVNGASFAPPIINPFGIRGVGGLANPHFVDIDGDGDHDLFVGTATGTTVFYRNTGTRTSPNFVRGDDNPFGLTPVVGAAAPFFVDVENDGDFDAFIGASDGTTTYFVNIGTPTEPRFVNTSTSGIGNAVSNDSSDTNSQPQLPPPLPNVGANATPVLVDINGDGLLDAFIGEQDGIINFVNGVIEGGDYPVPVNLGEGTITLGAFKGVGDGTNVPPIVDQLHFFGEGLTAQNLLLNQNGDDLEISFEGIEDTQVILKSFELENLDNLPDGVGNIIFDGQTELEDSFDVIPADANPTQVEKPNTVTFLNDLDNFIEGLDDSNDVINGLGGNDTIAGLGGDDFIRGGEGDDVLWGDENSRSTGSLEGGNDTLIGGSGNDQLFGGSGDDYLDGGEGIDLLIGGEGADQFAIANRPGIDIILDFEVGIDRLILTEGLSFDQLELTQRGSSVFINLLETDQILAIVTGTEVSQLSESFV